jgi:hypothetical protein
MKTAIQIGMLAAGIIVMPFRSRAQSNVYSLSICAGGVSTSPILQIGPWPNGFCIYRESYWTDPLGRVVSLVANPKGIQPSDKHHVETKVYLGRASLSIPLSPLVVGMLAACALMLMIVPLAAFYARKSRFAQSAVSGALDR